MPFRSKAQQRWMFAAEARGEVPPGTARRWMEETPNFKRLPERVGRKTGRPRKRDRRAEMAITAIKKAAKEGGKGG